MNWWDTLKTKFVDNFRQWYKMWSSWMAIVWGIVVTVFWNDPGLLGRLVSELPEETRAMLSPVVLAVVSGLPIIVRLLKQQSLTKPASEIEVR